MKHPSKFLSLSCLLVSSTSLAMSVSVESLTLQQVKEPSELSAMIIGGDRASENQAPFYAQLVLYDESTGQYGTICGGTIINDKYILTAAHCVDDDVFNFGWTEDDLHVLVKNPTTNDIYRGEFKDVASFTIHPDYDASDLWINDIAVLELRTAITDNVQSIMLPQDFGDYSNRSEYQIFGVGLTSSINDTSPTYLQTAEIEPLTDAQCEALVGSDYNSAETLCGNGFEDREYTGICSGDSGGPLTYIDDSGDYQQIGISSYASTVCEEPELPSVFTEILNYTSWVETLTSDGNPIVFDADLAATEGYHSNGDTVADNEPEPSEPLDGDGNGSDPIDNGNLPSFSDGGSGGGSVGLFGLALLGLGSIFRKRVK